MSLFDNIYMLAISLSKKVLSGPRRSEVEHLGSAAVLVFPKMLGDVSGHALPFQHYKNVNS
jgi:hypothetical protein